MLSKYETARMDPDGFLFISGYDSGDHGKPVIGGGHSPAVLSSL